MAVDEEDAGDPSEAVFRRPEVLDLALDGENVLEEEDRYRDGKRRQLRINDSRPHGRIKIYLGEWP